MLSAELKGQVGPLALEVALDTTPSPLVLTGPNGSGKTSLLLMILGVLSPAEGRISLGGRALFDARARLDVPVERRAIGYVPQSYGLFPHMTAAENVEFPLASRRERANRRERSERARALLADVGLADLANRRPAELSAGERQRVALARAFASEPRALLLDEPFAALDAGTRRQVRGFLAGYLERLALPTIVVSHDAADMRALGRRIAVLESGRVVQRGTFDELARSPATEFVRELTL